MRKRLVLLICLLLVVAASSLEAQATRTWVSGVGDDANPCSRTAPCKTFAGAISKTAANGEISVLDPGGFGAVTITKSISIVADGVEGGLLAAGTNGVIINAAATDSVTLRGLTITGAGTGLNGIRILSAAVVHVEDCTIENMNNGIFMEPSVPIQVMVLDTVIRNNNGATGGGVTVRPTVTGSANVTFDNVRIDRNRFGLRVEDRAKVVINNSVVSSNQSHAIRLVSSGAAVEVTANNVVASHNLGAGMRADGMLSIARISNFTAVDNNNGVQSAMLGQVLSYGNNRIAGNGVDGAPTGNLAEQ